MLRKLNCFLILGEDTPSTPLDVSAGPAVKRRPGRPRLRPVGPAHQGSRKPSTPEAGSGKKIRRGAPSGPRVIKPLPVPIGSIGSKSVDGRAVAGPSSTSSPSTSKVHSNTPGYYGSP